MTQVSAHALAAGVRAACDAGLPTFHFADLIANQHVSHDGSVSFFAHTTEECERLRGADPRAVRVERGQLGAHIPAPATWALRHHLYECVCVTSLPDPWIDFKDRLLGELGLAHLSDADITLLQRASRAWDPTDVRSLRPDAAMLVEFLTRRGSVWDPLGSTTGPSVSDLDFVRDVSLVVDAVHEQYASANARAVRLAGTWPRAAVARHVVAGSDIAHEGALEAERVSWVAVSRPWVDFTQVDEVSLALSVLVSAPVVAVDPNPRGPVVVALTALEYQAVATAVGLGGDDAVPRVVSPHQWAVVFTMLAAGAVSLEDALRASEAALAT